MKNYPQHLGKYQILDQLGKGGFATVFRARDPDLERDVALKVLDPMLMRDPVWVQRFRREARAIARLDHPHIITIYEVGQSEGSLYIATKLVEEGSLADHIERSGPVPWAETVRLVGEIAEALDMDAVELRLKNIVDEGDPGPTGQKLTGVGVREALEKAAAAINWDEPSPPNRGKGVAISWWTTTGGSSGVSERNTWGVCSGCARRIAVRAASTSGSKMRGICENGSKPNCVKRVHSRQGTSPSMDAT